MIAAALLAFSQIFTPPLRKVFWRALGITVLLLILVWFAIQGLLALFVAVPYPWLDTVLAILAGLGLFIGLIFLAGPITSLVAGIFLDEIAQVVERTHYPADVPGRELPVVQSLALSVKFFLLVILVNLVALALLLLPGINIVAFLGANGYLLGREYFQLAAMRHMSVADAMKLREEHRVHVFLAGLIIAGFVAVPLLNLLTPLFATAFMVHVFKRLQPRAQEIEPAPAG